MLHFLSLQVTTLDLSEGLDDLLIKHAEFVVHQVLIKQIKNIMSPIFSRSTATRRLARMVTNNDWSKPRP